MSSLFDSLKQLVFPGTAARTNETASDVDDYIERVVEGIDTRLRLVPGYKRKLRDAVSLSLSHIDQLVDRIPGPIEVSKKTYASNPDVRAYFATPDVLQETVNTAEEVNTYFAEHGNSRARDMCALLCARMEEKTVTGTELTDGVLRHDVLQTTINFSDYKVVAPAPRDDEVRNGIKNCIFDGLITYALQQIVCIKTRRRDLTDEYRILNARLRTRQAKGNGLSTMLVDACNLVDDTAEIRAQLAVAENELNTMLEHKDVLGFYLEEIRKIFSAPHDFIHLNDDNFRLTDMRVKVSENAPQPASSVSFSEIEIINVLKRVVAIIHYHRDDPQRS